MHCCWVTPKKPAQILIEGNTVNTSNSLLTTIIPREVIILAGSLRVGFTGLGEAPWMTLQRQSISSGVGIIHNNSHPADASNSLCLCISAEWLQQSLHKIILIWGNIIIQPQFLTAYWPQSFRGKLSFWQVAGGSDSLVLVKHHGWPCRNL